ncbi:MAG: carbon-nitrogen family hydrolase [Bacilli bacterium]
MKVASINFSFVYENPEMNEQTMWRLLGEAVTAGAEVVLLPELWLGGYDLHQLEKYAVRTDRLKKEIQLFASKHSVYVVAGSVVEKEEGRYYNRMYTFAPTGETVYTYDKTHLFRPMNEDDFFSSGNKIGTFALGNFCASGMICYDIRFAPWTSKVRDQGANVLFVSAQWPVRRRNHWRTLLIARAIECGMYVVASNICGSDANNSFGGGSMIIDPWGEVLAEAEQTEQIIFAEMKLQEIEEVRARIPVWSDRREELY